MARMTSIWANQLTRWFGLPYGDQGLLVSCDLLCSVGGYVELPIMEDVAVVQRFKRRLNSLPLMLITSATGYERPGWLLKGAKNIWNLIRYYAGKSAESIARDYDRH